MKHRRFLITSALAVLLGLGVGAATIATAKRSTSVKAADTACDVYFKASWSGAQRRQAIQARRY